MDENLKTLDHKKYNALIVVLFALSWFSMKMSLPTLPVLIHVFTTNAALIRLSVTCFFMGYGLSQLFWGAFSQSHGRRLPLFIGMMLAVVGTLVVIFSFSITSYMIGRTLEGIGIGSISPTCRAILSDTRSPKDIAKIWPVISIIACNMPAVAPICGGYIMVLLNWRAVFIVFLCLLLVVFIWFFMVYRETSQQISKQLRWGSARQVYFSILKTPAFFCFAICYLVLNSMLLAYYTAMPFWFVKQLGLAESNYAYLAVFSVGSYTAGLLLSRIFCSRFELIRFIHCAMLLASLAGMLALILWGAGIYGVLALVLTMSIFAFATGVMNPAANTLLLSHFKTSSATASALLTTLLFSLTGLLSWVESQFNVSSMLPLGLFIIILVVLALLIHKRLLPAVNRFEVD